MFRILYILTTIVLAATYVVSAPNSHRSNKYYDNLLNACGSEEVVKESENVESTLDQSFMGKTESDTLNSTLFGICDVSSQTILSVNTNATSLQSQIEIKFGLNETNRYRVVSMNETMKYVGNFPPEKFSWSQIVNYVLCYIVGGSVLLLAKTCTKSNVLIKVYIIYVYTGAAPVIFLRIIFSMVWYFGRWLLERLNATFRTVTEEAEK